MGIVKDFQFPVSVQFEGGRMTRVTARDKDALRVATPPEFRGGILGFWSPEDLLVASAASCYAVTLAAVAERREVPLHALTVHGTGHVSKRDDGNFGFVAIELTATVETDPRFAEAAAVAAKRAEQACLVSAALEIPVHVETRVHATAVEEMV